MRLLDRPDTAALKAYLAQWLDMTPVALEPLLPYFRDCRFDAGDHLFQLGDPVDDLVLLTHGLVRCYYVHGSREINLRLLSAPAAALPYQSYLDQKAAEEALQALSEGSGYWVRFRAFCRDHPGLLAETMRRELAERCLATADRLDELLEQRETTRSSRPAGWLSRLGLDEGDERDEPITAQQVLRYVADLLDSFDG